MTHNHFRVLYERNPQDAKVNSDPGGAIARAAAQEFGVDSIRYSQPRLKNVASDYPVLTRDGRIEPAISVSEMLSKLRPTSIDCVFVKPDHREKAEQWLLKNREQILAAAREQEDEDHETKPKGGGAGVANPTDAE